MEPFAYVKCKNDLLKCLDYEFLLLLANIVAGIFFGCNRPLFIVKFC